MKIAGIDYSITSPAMVIADTDKSLSFDDVEIFCMAPTPKLVGWHGNVRCFEKMKYTSQEQRINDIADYFIAMMLEHSVERVVMESYSYGSTGLTFNLAENVGVLKNKMWVRGIIRYDIAPQSVKKFFTGSGRADKLKMIEVFYAVSGVQRSINDIIGIKSTKPNAKPVDDIADAFGMAYYLYHHKNLWKNI
jgi:Holliday junction resolvasome RuvABC endonuclease subunit